MKYKKLFPKFVKTLDKKMAKGFAVYGDVSFSRSPKELIEELQSECLDLAGWGMILWERLNQIKKGAKKIR
jgi:hypothetical protein